MVPLNTLSSIDLEDGTDSPVIAASLIKALPDTILPSTGIFPPR